MKLDFSGSWSFSHPGSCTRATRIGVIAGLLMVGCASGPALIQVEEKIDIKLTTSVRYEPRNVPAKVEVYSQFKLDGAWVPMETDRKKLNELQLEMRLKTWARDYDVIGTVEGNSQGSYGYLDHIGNWHKASERIARRAADHGADLVTVILVDYNRADEDFDKHYYKQALGFLWRKRL